MKMIVPFLLLTTTMANTALEQKKEKIDLLYLPGSMERTYSVYADVIKSYSDEQEKLMGANALIALKDYILGNAKYEKLKSELLDIIELAKSENSVVRASSLKTFTKVFNLFRFQKKFLNLSKLDKQEVLLIVNLAYFAVDYLTQENQNYFKIHDLMYVDVNRALKELLAIKSEIANIKTFGMHPAITGFVKNNHKELKKLKRSAQCKDKYLFEYFNDVLKLEKPQQTSKDEQVVTGNNSSSAAECLRNNFINPNPTPSLRIDDNGELIAVGNTCVTLIMDNFENSDYGVAVRYGVPMKTIYVPTQTEGCETKDHVYTIPKKVVDHEEWDRILNRNRYYVPPVTLPGMPGYDNPLTPRIPTNPSGPRVLPPTELSGVNLKTKSSSPPLFRNALDQYLDNEIIKGVRNIRRSYSYNFGMFLEVKESLKREFNSKKSFNDDQYNLQLDYLVTALNIRYGKKFYPPIVFVDEISIENALSEIDYTMNDERPVDLTEYCMEKDINDCDGKILQPTIYVLNYDTKIKVNSLLFHPLSLVKSFGKDVDIEANKLIGAWIDTSGRKLIQKDDGKLVDPGYKATQIHSHKKKDWQDCGYLRDNCKTYHYYSFSVSAGKQPRKRVQKRPSEKGGDITFKVYQDISTSSILVANGGHGDKGLVGAPSPSCDNPQWGINGWKQHLLRNTGWIYVGGSRDYNRALRNSKEDYDVTVAQGVSGDGANGGRGGNITLALPKGQKSNLVYSVHGGNGGEPGEPNVCGPVKSENYKSITGNQGAKGNEGVINEKVIN